MWLKWENMIVKLLIENGAEIDTVDTVKNNVLHYAILQNHTKTMKTLLSHDTSLIVKNGQGENPFCFEKEKFGTF